MHLEVKY